MGEKYILGGYLGRFESYIPPGQNALFIGVSDHFGEVGEVFLHHHRFLCGKSYLFIKG